MTVQCIQFCPSLQLLQSFFQNIALKGYSTWHIISTLQKNFLRSVDPKQPKISTLHSDLSLKLSQVEVQKFSSEVQNDLMGGAHLPTPPLKIRPWSTYSFVLLTTVNGPHTINWLIRFCHINKWQVLRDSWNC
jgi:hypothetical protein